MTQTITIKEPKAPASDKQINFLAVLVEERECPSVAERVQFAKQAGFLSKGAASGLISEALKAPKKAAKAAKVTDGVSTVIAVEAPKPVEIPDAPAFGYYLIDGTVYYWDVTGKDAGPTLRKLVKVTQYGGAVKGKWIKIYSYSNQATLATATFKPYGPKSADYYQVKTAKVWVHKLLMSAVAAGATPMSMQEAAQQGHMLGFCIRCGATLTDPESVAAGIGPVCKGYWF